MASLSTDRIPGANGGSSRLTLEPALLGLATLLLEIARGQAMVTNKEHESVRGQLSPALVRAMSEAASGGSDPNGRSDGHAGGGERAHQRVAS
jgi:hypothetical protein